MQAGLKYGIMAYSLVSTIVDKYFWSVLDYEITINIIARLSYVNGSSKLVVCIDLLLLINIMSNTSEPHVHLIDILENMRVTHEHRGQSTRCHQP